MCVIDWALVLGFFRVVLSWPVAVFAIAVLVIFHFKVGIAGLIPRIEKAGPAGLSFTPESQQVPASIAAESPLQQAAEAAAPEPLNQPPNRNFTMTLMPSEQIANQVMDYVSANPGPTIDEYAKLLAAYNSERTFSAIFGSQIEALLKLSAAETPIPAQALAPFHAKHLQRLGANAHSFDDFIQFMVNTHLMQIGPAGVDFEITMFGMRFLDYIRQNYENHWEKPYS